MTLMEMMVSLTILCIVSASAVTATRNGSGAFENASRNSHLEARVRRALDRASFELITTIEADLQPAPTTPFGTADLLFRQPAGFALGAVIPGDFMRLAFQRDPGEADDGIDNDGDGLVDEGRLRFVRDDGGPNEIEVILCHGVAEYLEGEVPNGVDDNGNGLIDEAGFCVQLEGNVLVVRLSLQAAGQPNVVTRTLQTSIGLRN